MNRAFAFCAAAITLVVLPAAAWAEADLTVADIQGPDVLFAGRPADVTFTIRNIGDQTAQSFNYRVYLSDNRVITLNDPEVHQGGPVTVAAGGALPVSVTVNVPTSIVPGDYYIGVILDPEGAITEPNRVNNAKHSAAKIPLKLPAPDLTASELRIPDRAAAGETIPVTFTIENRGNEPATFRYGVYVSHNDIVSPADVILFLAQRSLDPGEQRTISDYVRLFPGMPAGQWYLGVVMDPEHTVDELDEENNARTAPVPLEVFEPELRVLTSFVPDALVGVPFEWRFAAIGGTGRYTFHVVGGTLPDGVTLDESTGILSGTPAATGEYPFTLEVQSGGLSSAAAFRLVVTQPTVNLTVQSERLPPAVLQTEYETQLVAVGGAAPYRWSYEGDLPDGMQLTEEGLLSGTPELVGSYDLAVRVVDARGEVATRQLSLEVVDRGLLTILTGLLPVGQTGREYIAGFEVLGGTPPVVFALVGGELPPGLSLDASTGIVSGQPLSPGRFAFQVQATDASGLFDTNAYVIEVVGQPISIVTTEIDSAEVGQPYEQRFNVLPSTGEPPFEWRLRSGALPPGLTLDSAEGVISGTPEAGSAGTWPLLVEVEDARGVMGQRPYVLEVRDPAREAELKRQPEPGGGCSSAGGSGLFALLVVLLAFSWPRLRRWLLPLAVLFAAWAPRGAHAQQWTYVLTESQLTYQPISGSVVTLSSTDYGRATVSLPFTFVFYGTPYNEVTISADGLVLLGTGTAGSSNRAIPNASSPNGFVAGWWDDMDGENGDIQTTTLGTAPNRVFVIQYRNWDRYFPSSTSTQVNFQIKLYERSNVIQIHYGPFRAGNTNDSATVGIESPDGQSGVEGLACVPGCTAADLLANRLLTFSIQPDLQTPSATAPTIVYGAIPAQVSAQVVNAGGQDAGAFTVQAVLSSDDTYDPGTDQVLTGSAQVPSLGAGQGTEVSFLAEIPGTVVPDTDYWLFVVPNLDGALVEASTANNVSPPVQVRTGPPTANFRASSVTPSATSVAPGDTLDLTYRLDNTGNLGGSADFRIVLSANPIISIEDLTLYSGNTTLSAKGFETRTTTVTIPSDLTTGAYYLGVLVDPDDAVPEPDEVDNAAHTDTPVAIEASRLTLLTQDLPIAQVGRAYQVNLQASGAGGAYRFEVASGMLPPGIELSEDGVLQGRPTAAGDYAFQVLIRSGGKTGLGNLSLTVAEVDAPLTVVSVALPDAIFGGEYEARLVAAGGVPPYTWSLASGALPSGLGVLPSGRVGGLPAEDGDFSFTVRVTDAEGSAAEQGLSLRVVQPGNLIVVTMDLPPAKLGQPYEVALRAAGGTPPYKWNLDGTGRLPAGLTLEVDGRITGTPEEVGVFDIQVAVRDELARFDTNTLALTVGFDQGISITTTALPVATYGEPYAATLTAVGGRSPYRWALVGGELPAGLDLDGETGTISGVAVGDEEVVLPFVVEAIDAAGRRDIRGLALRAQSAPNVIVEEGGCSSAAGQGAPSAFALFAVALFALLRPRRRR